MSNTDINVHHAYKYIGWNNISSERPVSHIKFDKIMSELPIVDTLFVLSRIDLILTKKTEISSKIQDNIIDILFERPMTQILKNILLEDNRAGLFHHQQIYFFMGQVLLKGNNRYIGNISKELLVRIGSGLIAE